MRQTPILSTQHPRYTPCAADSGSDYDVANHSFGELRDRRRSQDSRTHSKRKS